MNVLCIGDLHLADKPPASCTDAYLREQWSVLEQSLEIARRHDAVPVFAGDIFHVKTSNRNSHALVSRLIEVCQDHMALAGLQPRVVPGNHDIRQDRYETLGEQPLGVILSSGAMAELCGNDFLFGENLVGVPWGHAPVEALHEGTLVVAHASLFPGHLAPPFDHWTYEDWAAVQKRGVCYYGHIHEAHPEALVGGVTFLNAGALTRGSLHEYNLVREVGVTLIQSGPGPACLLSSTWHALETLPAGEVLRVDEKAEAQERVEIAAEFMARLPTLEVDAQANLEAIMDQIQRSPEVETGVRDRALALIRGAAEISS